jgi:hypothetical protein
LTLAGKAAALAFSVETGRMMVIRNPTGLNPFPSPTIMIAEKAADMILGKAAPAEFGDGRAAR